MSHRLQLWLAVFSTALGGTVVTAVLFLITIAPVGHVANTPLENIDGITYPVVSQNTTISESFAHTDVLLNSSRFGEALHIAVEFNPGNATRLAVAVRENSFWFSYHPVTFYDLSVDGPAKTTLQRTVTVPLTDKIQDKDQSLDLIFFAQNGNTPVSPDHDRTKDTVSWTIDKLDLTTSHMPVSVAEAKQWLRRLIHGERPI